MTHENEQDRDDKALLEAIVYAGRKNPLYAPDGKTSLRDKAVVALFTCLIALMVLAFILLGVFFLYLMYVFWRESPSLVEIYYR